MHTQILIKPFVRLTRIELHGIVKLLRSVWPTDNSTNERLSDYLAQHNDRKDCHVALQFSKGRCQAHGEIFYREMVNAERSFDAGCLASVCVAAELRGQGLGHELVRKLFEWSQVRQPVPVLFQTSVPEFYERLGCMKTDNPFIDSKARVPNRSPWWDKHVMVYSPTAPWPTGLVDLNGPGF